MILPNNIILRLYNSYNVAKLEDIFLNHQSYKPDRDQNLSDSEFISLFVQDVQHFPLERQQSFEVVCLYRMQYIQKFLPSSGILIY